MELPVVEHESSRTGRWLRRRRTRLALWIAVIEGLLVVFGVIPRWRALIVGAVIVASTSWSAGTRQRHGRAATLDRRLPQALVALVPIAAFVLDHARAIVVVAVIAVVALVLLFRDRR